jgi:hypothetical protein
MPPLWSGELSVLGRSVHSAHLLLCIVMVSSFPSKSMDEE